MTLNRMQMAGQIKVMVTCAPLDLLKFLKRNFMPMNQLGERAGMFEERIYDRTNALFEYFDLPYYAEPTAAKRL